MVPVVERYPYPGHPFTGSEGIESPYSDSTKEMSRGLSGAVLPRSQRVSPLLGSSGWHRREGKEGVGDVKNKVEGP